MKEQEDHTTSPVLQITPLERGALQLLSNGLTASELSCSLHLTVLETQSLVTRLFAALGATTQAEAVGLARQRGLVTSDGIRIEQVG